MRSEFHEALGHIVHARISYEALTLNILRELQSGHRPTYRGEELTKETMDLLELAGTTIEMTFALLKAVQFPEMAETRIADIRSLLSTGVAALPNPPRR